VRCVERPIAQLQARLDRVHSLEPSLDEYCHVPDHDDEIQCVDLNEQLKRLKALIADSADPIMKEVARLRLENAALKVRLAH